MIPFCPEPKVKLKARFPAALEDVYNIELIRAGKITRPGIIPKHVFDFEDGMRLIISRELYPDGVITHVSASWDLSVGPCPWKKLEDGLEDMLNRFAELGGKKPKKAQLRVTAEKGVPHLFF